MTKPLEMLRRHVASALRGAGTSLLGLHGGEITALPSLWDFHTGAARVHTSPLRSGKSLANGALGEALPLPPPFQHTRRAASSSTAGGGGSSVPEQFDLTPPETGTVRIDGYDGTGFIVGDVQVEGSILCCGDLWLQWRPTHMADITIDTLALLDLVKPAPDILVLGCGARIHRVPPELARALEERNVAVEAQDTRNAVATFNILNQEGRKVVGALLPAGAE